MLYECGNACVGMCVVAGAGVWVVTMRVQDKVCALEVELELQREKNSSMLKTVDNINSRSPPRFRVPFGVYVT